MSDSTKQTVGMLITMIVIILLFMAWFIHQQQEYGLPDVAYDLPARIVSAEVSLPAPVVIAPKKTVKHVPKNDSCYVIPPCLVINQKYYATYTDQNLSGDMRFNDPMPNLQGGNAL